MKYILSTITIREQYTKKNVTYLRLSVTRQGARNCQHLIIFYSPRTKSRHCNIIEAIIRIYRRNGSSNRYGAQNKNCESVGLMSLVNRFDVEMLQILSFIPSFSTLHIMFGWGPFRIVILILFFWATWFCSMGCSSKISSLRE